MAKQKDTCVSCSAGFHHKQQQIVCCVCLTRFHCKCVNIVNDDYDLLMQDGFRTVLILALATCAFAGYLGYGGYAAAPLAHSSVAHHTPYFSYGYGQQSVGHGYGLGYGLGYGHGLIGGGWGAHLQPILLLSAPRNVTAPEFRTVLILALATCAFAGYLGYGGYAAAPLAHSGVAHHTPYFSYGYGQQSVGHGYGLGYGLGYGHSLIGSAGDNLRMKGWSINSPRALGADAGDADFCQTFRTVLILALATCAFAGYLGYGGYATAPLAHSSVAHHTPYFSYGYGQQSVGHGYGLGYGLGYGHGLIGHRYGGFY
ncbi:hypothetical protein HPB47_015748 [Ixodes persulcatus]|uniref:Uncharacterized protein n=1 Tax=Ixodes persulcatus TaxID=34615 RepID=A0AC60QSR7_IXOPE|nr:hypothetical protein HPB47_015748 [Ixodes persulcatus]